MKNKLLALLAFFLFYFFVIRPVVYVGAAENTTIIALDPNRNYEKGEIVKVTVGISSTDGSYLKSANVGFGYNGSTMKLLTETDTEDHFYVESEKPVKWLYYDMEFEMLNDGKMYFIAGAYDGDGVIKAIKADGSRINLPRASVVRKIGTGIFTKSSDCNLKEIVITTENGSQLELNRDFDKNITEYWATVEASIDEVDFDGIVENENDKIIIPDPKLLPGENTKEVFVEAIDGVRKKYIFHITRPEQPLEITSIKLFGSDGNEIPYEFNQDTTEYYIEIENEIDSITFKGETPSKYVVIDGGENLPVREGYDNFNVVAKTESEEKTYHYNIFRKTPELRLLSLIGELSDETVLTIDQEFGTEVYEYTAKVTSDIKSVKFLYTLASKNASVKENPIYELDEGVNVCSITVTDGVNEIPYKVTIIKDAYDVTEKEDPTRKPIVNKREIKSFVYKNRQPITIVSIVIVVILIITSLVNLKDEISDYTSSEEKAYKDSERERKARLKEMKKKRKEKDKK